MGFLIDTPPWLAAQAVQRDFTILTANPKDFRDVPGLKFIEVPIPP